jgi:N-methylhydantoinase A/oxoprolinase/acetone carboxylase beta subunit
LKRPTARIVGVDTGGTFTDVVFDDGRVLKIPSTPDDPSRAVALGAAQTEPSTAAADHTPPAVLAHGTTVATNTLLQRRGASVALVTNAGFEDVIEIARQDRPSLYDPDAVRPEPLVPRELRLGVAGRLAADGSVLAPVVEADVPHVPADVDAVAVCLLHADLDPEHEMVVERALSATGRRAVFRSSAYFPEYREYERTVTTVVNAYLAPVCQAYLESLASLAAEVFVMTSAGGLVDLSEARDRPASLLLSGPAAGAQAGAAAAVAAGFPDVVTFDMGGTSTDVCLVRAGAPDPASQRSVAGLPIRAPALDIHTIGAGGGSIARIDAGGALRVGPESAGARPGPVCYAAGGAAA